MKLKFRPSFEQLDARDLPSANPLDPPDSTPPTAVLNWWDKTGDTWDVADRAAYDAYVTTGLGGPPDPDQQPGATDNLYPAVSPFVLDPAQLDAMLADGELTTAELETLLGVDLDGEDNPTPADPQPGQPNPQPPASRPPFSPIPALTDPKVGAPVVPNLDFTNNGAGGLAANDQESAEITTLLKQVKAINIGIDEINFQIKLEKIVRRGSAAALVPLDTQLSLAKSSYGDAETQLTSMRKNPGNYTAIQAQEILQAMSVASFRLAQAQLAYDAVAKVVANVDQRIKYLEDKIRDLMKLRNDMNARINTIIGNLSQGRRGGDPLIYVLPTFLDWTGNDWKDLTKPLPGLQATIPGK